MFSLKDKSILITGASRGIGAAAAKLCAKAGGRVYLHASGDSDALSKVASDIGAGPDQIALRDLSQPGAGFDLIAAVTARAGRLHAVVNNAGIYLPTALSGLTEDWNRGWIETLAVNVRAPADICRAAIGHFREANAIDQKGGRVVNLASRASYRGDGEDFAAYAASKAAINAMTKTWARALSGENILFYAIAPGWVETRMAPQDVENRKAAVEEIPLGRVAQPEEVGALIAFLLSDACQSATGSTFDINGASYVR